MVGGIKSLGEIKAGQQVSPQVAQQGNQSGFHTIARLEAKLKWIQTVSIVQESLELCGQHSLDYLAPKWKKVRAFLIYLSGF